ncbi:Uncharacterised protein [Burkholderia cepacia]|nr:hypothetical protein DM41_2768 [Burkholderia cepacia ATCC 25416]SPU85194.1 Uncharacterised protein [Burkholderia cepacia]
MLWLARNLLYMLESLKQGGWRQIPGVRRERAINGIDVFECRCDKCRRN